MTIILTQIFINFYLFVISFNVNTTMQYILSSIVYSKNIRQLFIHL